MAPEKKHSHSHSRSLEQVLGDLKKAQLKLTGPRKAILELLVREHGPFSAEDVQKKISRRTCDQATVYRTLASLEEVGILRRCEFGDGTARYELTDGSGHHHHLICRSCKRVDVVDDCELEGLNSVAEKRGFAEVSHILEFFGICPDCR